MTKKSTAKSIYLPRKVCFVVLAICAWNKTALEWPDAGFKKVDMKINRQNKQQQYIFKKCQMKSRTSWNFFFSHSIMVVCVCVFCECVDEIADNQWRNKNQSCELKSNFISLTWSHHITDLDICLSRFFFIANFRLCFGYAVQRTVCMRLYQSDCAWTVHLLLVFFSRIAFFFAYKYSLPFKAIDIITLNHAKIIITTVFSPTNFINHYLHIAEFPNQNTKMQQVYFKRKKKKNSHPQRQ